MEKKRGIFKTAGLLVGMIGMGVLLLSACGNSEQSSGNEQRPIERQEEHKVDSAYPRTINDARGEVTLAKEPKRIAVVHWGIAESLFAFEMDALGVTVPFSQAQSSLLHHAYYQPYIEQIGEVTVVGENTAPNLEAVLAFEPDLIIAGSQTNEDSLAQLDEIATTVVIDESATNVYQDWHYVLQQLGEILGQQEAAKQFVAKFDALSLQAAQQAGTMEGEVLFVQVREKQVYVQPAEYLAEYYETFGMLPPVSEASELTLEGLSVIDPAHLFLGYFNREDTTLPAIADEWEESPVWQQLQAVRENQVYKLNGQVAYSYGPLSKSYGIEEISRLLAERQ